MGQESREAREEKNAIILEVVVHIEMVYNLKLCMEREGKKEGRQEGRKGGREPVPQECAETQKWENLRGMTLMWGL